MRATRLVITLLAFLPSLFIIKADETELTEMRLVSDSLIYMIQSNVDCDGQKKFAELTFGDRGFNAGLLFATVTVKYNFCGLKINVTDYTFWIFIEISNDRIVLMDTNATSRH